MSRDSRPRVALFAATFERGRGGIARIARLMARVLAGMAGDGVITADAWSLLDHDSPQDLGLPVRGMGGRRLRFVTHGHRAALSHSHFLYDQLGLVRAHPRVPPLRRPCLAYCHGVEIWQAARRDRLAAARRADALVIHSRHSRDRAAALHRGFARARICWPATETDLEADRPVPGPPRVLMVSRVDESYKGHRLLVECWPRVVAAVPAARLTFAGQGPRLGELRQWVADSPVGDRIEVRGFVPDDELEALYARSTVLALPSRGEGFGLVYVEAMRHGLAVVATVHDAGAEVNVDGVTGYNVNLDRPDELPARLIELVSDPRRAAAMGRHGRRRWAEHFRFRAFQQRFSALLDEFLRRGRLDP